jgi:hypothetical protein
MINHIIKPAPVFSAGRLLACGNTAGASEAQHSVHSEKRFASELIPQPCEATPRSNSSHRCGRERKNNQKEKTPDRQALSRWENQLKISGFLRLVLSFAPHRYDKNIEKEIQATEDIFEFQFLIGKIQTEPVYQKPLTEQMFQFLIGKIQTRRKCSMALFQNSFNSL